MKTPHLNFSRRIGLLCLLFCLFLSLPATAQAGIQALSGERAFPCGWHGRLLVDKPLAESAGRWESYELRSPSGELALLQFLSEAGAGPLYIPDSTEEKLDGPLGMGATYKAMNEGLFRAICETHPYLGSTVTAVMPSGSIVVLESKTLSIERMLVFCHLLASPSPDDANDLQPLFVVP